MTCKLSDLISVGTLSPVRLNNWIKQQLVGRKVGLTTQLTEVQGWTSV
jgi:hypothetical protein